MLPKKAIVVLSGGMDSTTLLHYLKNKDYEVYGVTFSYAQRHEKELIFAEYWGKKLCDKWHKLDISFMEFITSNSALIDKNINLPQDHYTNENQKVTVVPNRNMVMLSIAIAWAENLGVKHVYFGAHANDQTIYPDCREEFVFAISRASQLATYTNVEVKAPFAQMHKYEIAKLGSDLGVDYSKTWSCYEGLDRHCGKCATCQERKEAFEKNNIQDVTEYQN